MTVTGSPRVNSEDIAQLHEPSQPMPEIINVMPHLFMSE